MIDMITAVGVFHSKFKIDYTGPPRILPEDMAYDRINFMNEELDEYVKASAENNKEEMLDAIIDLIYVCVGTGILHGFDLDEAFRRVHMANIKKEAVPNLANGKMGIIKPEGWKPPNLEDLV